MTESASPTYSTAFERMTRNDPADIVGLVAYALYKDMIREEVMEGVRKPDAPKNPSQSTVEFYRNAAVERLNRFAAASIDEAVPEIQQSALLNRFETTSAELRRHITDCTSTGRAIWTNIVGWAITIVVTVIALLMVRLPDLPQTIDSMIPGTQSGDLAEPGGH